MFERNRGAFLTTANVPWLPIATPALHAVLFSQSPSPQFAANMKYLPLISFSENI